MKILQPLFIAMILKYFNGSIELNETLIYASVIAVFASVGGVLHHPYYYFSTKYGMQVRLACSGLIYRKIFRCGITSFESTSSGDICNLLAVDLTRIETAIMFVTYLAIGIHLKTNTFKIQIKHSVWL
jgi:ATP-binding cassette subfamily C (CFTR/MRP) protein 4